jgi:hypothetical protein
MPAIAPRHLFDHHARELAVELAHPATKKYKESLKGNKLKSRSGQPVAARSGVATHDEAKNHTINNWVPVQPECNSW